MATFYKIAAVTVGSGGTSSIAFTSIPQTYTDLKILWAIRCVQTGNIAGDVKISINGSTANFTSRRLFGDGATKYADAQTNWIGIATSLTATASTFSNGEMYLPNYTSTSVQKSLSIDSGGENNATATYLGFIAGRWASTSAITSINIQPDLGSTGSNFAQYSTFYLYGVLKA